MYVYVFVCMCVYGEQKAHRRHILVAICYIFAHPSRIPACVFRYICLHEYTYIHAYRVEISRPTPLALPYDNDAL